MIEPVIALYQQTFADAEGEAEGKNIGGLVRSMLTTTGADDLFGFVAMLNDNYVGAILFTRMCFEIPVNSFILSPVAVSTKVQKQGIGQQLINHGIGQLAEQGAELLLTYGDPNYYSKVGFEPITEQQIKAPQPMSFPHGWLGQSLVAETVPSISGDSRCVDALNKPEYW
ncbi:N-acetyltransferase [Thalassotalea sp. LPB0316]|nr:N-acetyltransferase [Thalassotalea sp. LPB0316]